MTKDEIAKKEFLLELEKVILDYQRQVCSVDELVAGLKFLIEKYDFREEENCPRGLADEIREKARQPKN
jgi:hypothetical protein